MITDARLLEINAIVADYEDVRDRLRAREAAAMRDLLAEVTRLREAVPYTEPRLMALVTAIRKRVVPEHSVQPDSPSARILEWCTKHAAGKYSAGDGEMEQRLRRAFLEGYLHQRNTIDARIGQAVEEWRGQSR